MRALITGGAGFIGSHLAELLLGEGHEVVAVDSLASGRTANLKQLGKNPKLSFHQVDIRDEDALGACFAGVDWVFHLAGLADIVPSIEAPGAYFQNVPKHPREPDCTLAIRRASAPRATGLPGFRWKKGLRPCWSTLTTGAMRRSGAPHPSSRRPLHGLNF